MRHPAIPRFTTLLLLALLPACSARVEGGHLAAMAREHARDVPVATPAARAPERGAVMGEEVRYGTLDGEVLTGYLAHPAGGGIGLPGVLVVHEWWGLNDNVRRAADRLADEGYTVLAVDLYGDEVAEDPSRARELATSVRRDPDAALANLRAAADYLLAERGAPRLGILGWCFGGGWSLQAALAFPDRLDAAVMYYGQVVTERERLRELEVPLLGHFGAEDRGIPVAEVHEMERVLAELGRPAAIHVYEGAGHAFANPSGGNYVEAAEEAAWERTREFLDRHLKTGG